MKIGLISLTSMQVAALRISVAGIAMAPLIRSNDWQKVKSKLHYFAIGGIVGSGIPAFLFTLAQTNISSSLAGALNGLTPLFALLIGILFLKAEANKRQLLGVFVGLIGAFLLLFHKGFGGQIWHTSLVVLATLCYGINVNIIKYKLAEFNPLLVAALPLAIASTLTTIYLAYSGIYFDFNSAAFNKSLLATIALALIGTAFSLYLFNILIQQTSAVFASSVTYLIPIVAMVWGLLDNETISINQIGGLVCILIAIRLIKRKK